MTADAAAVLAAMQRRSETLAIAESLTGGLLTSILVDVPGASLVVRGGIVAYQTDVKHDLLGVDAGLLNATGAVDPTVAEQMASGAAERLRADRAVATTGVAGPDPQDGHSVGEVFIAIASTAGRDVRRFEFAGDRSQIRRRSVDAAIDMLSANIPSSGYPS